MIPAYKKELNLIPDEVLEDRRRVVQRKGNTRLSIIILVVLSLVSAGFIAYNQYLQKQITDTQKDIARKTARIDELKEFGRDGYNLGLRLETIKEIVNNRHNFSDLTEKIKVRTPEQVSVLSYSMSAGAKEMSLNGTAYPNYTPIAEFQSNLLSDKQSERPIFNEVTIGSASYNKERGAVTFSFRVLVNPSALNEQLE